MQRMYVMFRVEMLNNFDGQKEVIECADFFALSWKLDGIKVYTILNFSMQCFFSACFQVLIVIADAFTFVYR